MEKIRRHDLDWLRVIVFGLLIFYHVGMFFVPWGWHIKNDIIYTELRWPMLFVNQWRLPILFVISGMGTAYALSFRSGGQFIKERFIRLYIPLAFGMLFIVSPQVYIERIVNGDYSGSYLDWYLSGTFINGIYPEGNFSWHHLWFLPYLLVFSVLLTPIFLHLRKNPTGSFLDGLRSRMKKQTFFLYVFCIPLFLFEAFMEPFFEITHNLIWDWFNFVSSLTLFFYGFILISIKDVFWQAIDTIKGKALIIGLFGFSGLLIIWLFFEDSIVIHFVEASLKTINLWSWILVLFGYAAKFLNKPSAALDYANRAVYPFYILHQTVTIFLGYFLMDLTWGFWPKFMILTVGTFGISGLLYEILIRRVRFLKPLFGLKINK